MTSVQTEHIGSVLLGMLLKMKHNGAVDIAREGLCSVVKRCARRYQSRHNAHCLISCTCATFSALAFARYLL